jgi:hypothetical protein
VRAFEERLGRHLREAGSTLGWRQAEAFKLLTNL